MDILCTGENWDQNVGLLLKRYLSLKKLLHRNKAFKYMEQKNHKSEGKKLKIQP